MAVRSVMHQAGAAVLTRLLCFSSPAAHQRTIPCACGRQAHYRELRSKPVLTVVGKVAISRPYYLCSHCHTGQFPADIELDVENTAARKPGSTLTKSACSIKAKSKSWSSPCAPPNQPIPKFWKRFALRQTTFSEMPGACDTQSSAVSIYSSAQASSKPAARPLSVPDSNNPACSGPSGAPTQSSLSDVVTSTAASRIIGRAAPPLDFHFYVAQR
jgi:hypothetical protein